MAGSVALGWRLDSAGVLNMGDRGRRDWGCSFAVPGHNLIEAGLPTFHASFTSAVIRCRRASSESNRVCLSLESLLVSAVLVSRQMDAIRYAANCPSED